MIDIASGIEHAVHAGAVREAAGRGQVLGARSAAVQLAGVEEIAPGVELPGRPTDRFLELTCAGQTATRADQLAAPRAILPGIVP